MLKHSARQSDNQSPSVARPSQQLWISAACPTIDHDARPESEVSSSDRPSLSPSCAGIMAAAGGIAVANLYYNQPMLPDIGRSFGVAADVIALLPMLAQIGYALGLFLFVPLGDAVDRRQLVLALLLGIIVSLLALAPSLVWLDIASLTLGMMSAVAPVRILRFGAPFCDPRCLRPRRGYAVTADRFS
jgi:MFS family permease